MYVCACVCSFDSPAIIITLLTDNTILTHPTSSGQHQNHHPPPRAYIPAERNAHTCLCVCVYVCYICVCAHQKFNRTATKRAPTAAAGRHHHQRRPLRTTLTVSVRCSIGSVWLSDQQKIRAVTFARILLSVGCGVCACRPVGRSVVWFKYPHTLRVPIGIQHNT